MKKNRKEGRPFKYEPSFRRKVALEYLSGEFSYNALMRKYQFKGDGNIKRWIKEYQKQEQELLTSGMEKPQDKKFDPTTEKTFQDLEAELKLARLKIIALETMIDVAEEQLHIDIRKKPGTKPSSE
jgi:transposase-like protein